MRIAHVITRMILGGAQENTLLTCEGLQTTYGDDVLLITGPTVGAEGSLLERARAGGVPTVVLPHLVRKISPWHDWQAYRAIRRELRAFRPDVVHTHSAKGGILGRFAARAERVSAIVHTVHGAPARAFGRGAALAVWCERLAAARCDRLVCVAEAMREQVLAARIAPPEKCVTIYSGMEVEPFLQAEKLREPTRAELGYSPDDVVITTVARLSPGKGHQFLVEAARELLVIAPQCRFLFVGDGPLMGTIKAQLQRAGIERCFHFTGLVPPERIPALLAASDVVVHTSLREGLARVLPQALLVGRPVVSFDLDGAREVVIPGETGLLVPAGDRGAFVTALGSLLREHAEPRQAFGLRGQLRFAETFRHERMTAQLRQLYAEILSHT